MIDETVRKKRLEDEIAGAKAGFDTSAADDALLRQDYPEPDEYTEQAERMVKTMRRDNPQWAMWHDPAQLKELWKGWRGG